MLPTRTTFVGQVRHPDQLAGLLTELASAGLVVEEVVRLAGPAGDDVTTYGIRVEGEGEIGASALRRLGWPHHVVAEQTVVRIAAGSADLLQWLKACTDAGAIIQSVRRIVPPPRSGPA
ncbi:MAG: hypothetical protein ABW075_02275 [Aeromicrobium sp.]